MLGVCCAIWQCGCSSGSRFELSVYERKIGDDELLCAPFAQISPETRHLPGALLLNGKYSLLWLGEEEKCPTGARGCGAGRCPLTISDGRRLAKGERIGLCDLPQIWPDRLAHASLWAHAYRFYVRI